MIWPWPTDPRPGSAHKDLAEHLAVVHAATEHARALHAATVVGEGDGAVGDHIAHLGHGLALKTAGHGARRIDAAVADLAARDLTNSTTVPLSVTGSVLGMAHTPVKPPLAAARVPLSMSSLTS